MSVVSLEASFSVHVYLQLLHLQITTESPCAWAIFTYTYFISMSSTKVTVAGQLGTNCPILSPRTSAPPSDADPGAALNSAPGSLSPTQREGDPRIDTPSLSLCSFGGRRQSVALSMVVVPIGSDPAVSAARRGGRASGPSGGKDGRAETRSKDGVNFVARAGLRARTRVLYYVRERPRALDDANKLNLRSTVTCRHT